MNKKTTTKKAPKKSVKKTPKKSVKSTIFSSVKNVGNSALLNLVRTMSQKAKRIVSIVELSEELTKQGTPTTSTQVRKKMQKIRRPLFSSVEEQENSKGNGQVQLSASEVLGWRKEEGKPIAYGIEKGTI